MMGDWKRILISFIIGIGILLNSKVIIDTNFLNDKELIVSRGKEFIAEVTAYSDYGITASGELVREGFVAADIDIFPFGTILFIETVGIVIVKDTGGLVEGNIIDVYMKNEADAWKFGRKKLKTYVLEEK